MTRSFLRSVEDSIAAKGNLCFGIDPHPQLLDAWGLPDSAQGVAEFSTRCIAAAVDKVAAVKPQVALFERHGSAGIRVLEQCLAQLRSAGILSIADAKRGDIGSTMQAYADAWVDEKSTLCADSVTVSPYLGLGALGPVFDTASQQGRGVFVLARTSNPEGASIQLARSDGITVAEAIISGIGALNAKAGDGALGIVLGATIGDELDLTDLGGPILMPGIGEQGGTRADAVRLVGINTKRTLASVSRTVLRAGSGAPDAATSVKQLRSAIIAAAEHVDLRNLT